MLIDSENLIARIDKCYQKSAKTELGLEPVMAIRDIKALISVMPEVDAVPIIRCKDCKWYDTEYHCKLNGYGCGRSPDWFCADGKKEEEDAQTEQSRK